MRRLLVASVLIAAGSLGPSSPSAQTRPPAGAGLASRLVALPDAAGRQALLAEHPAHVNADLLRALITEARRLIDATDARLPFAVGDVAAGERVVLQLAFSLEGLERNPSYRLVIVGTYRTAGRQRPFTVTRSIARPLPDDGDRRTRQVTAEARTAEGAVYPPSEIEERIASEPKARPLPEGRRIGDPGPDNPSVAVAETFGRVIPLNATTQADEEVSFVRVSNEPLTFADTKGGIPWDPSGASVDQARGAQVVFLTGNLYALLSTDGGATFTHLDPTTIFGNIPLDGMPEDQGLCCDMNLTYIPSLDRFVWVLHTFGSQVGVRIVEIDGRRTRVPVNGFNRLRVATATTQQVIASGGTSWTYWDMTTVMFGFGKMAFLDYPDVSFTDQFLHISVNETNSGGLFVIRVPLADVQSGGTINIGYTDPNDGKSAFGARLAHQASDAAYWFGHVTDSKVRIFEWLDNSNAYSWRSRTINTWFTGSLTSIVPDGVTNWLEANTTAIRGATVQGDVNVGGGGLRTILIAWNAGSAGSFTQPYVRLLPVTRLTFGNIPLWVTGQSFQIWHPDVAFNHAHLATNSNGEVGVSVGAGGPGSHATPVAGFVGDATLYVTGVSTTSLDRYGDYTAIRPHWPNSKLFSVSDYFLEAAGTGFRVRHQYRLFGRSSDVN
ncbi:MAG TPA: hypothetical protein VMO26_05060 [Vicinamibacterales bacterium]|nr:hypothetical protein [Vicinamibacterales bacterium]